MHRSRKEKDRSEREWRRRVRVRARMNAPSGWVDASILDVSSHGIMIHARDCAPPGARVELRGGDLVINARVVWRRGQRAGLQSREVLPLLDIMSLTDRPDPGANGVRPPLPLVSRPQPGSKMPEIRWPRLLERGALVMVLIAAVAMSALA